MANLPHERSCCPIACALDILGDKWTLLILRDLFLGRSYFSEFAASPERIATNILSARLSRLVNAGLVEKTASPDPPRRPAYGLTSKGRSLEPVLAALSRWGLENLPGTEVRLQQKS